MKKGDKLEVFIGGHAVAQAEIIYIGDGRAEMIIPATKVVMGVRTELDAAPAPVPATTETVITGIDRDGATSVDLPQQSTAQPVAPAQAVENNTAPPTPQTIVEAAGGQPEAVTQPTPTVVDNAPSTVDTTATPPASS